ncbi:MAG: hypothetical protein JAZ17_25205 [Candidatus Thiodiazotropha endolucinida]|nr:hypothetical protein [Candidatus Thiodiazotropha endolucinida]
MSDISLNLVNDVAPVTPLADIVFMHGISGDFRDTWTNKKTDLYWPILIATDNPDVNVWALDHSAKILSGVFTGIDRDFYENTKVFYQLLHSYGIGKRPFLFVCHSLGGLFAKAILRRVSFPNSMMGMDWMVNCKGLVFYATPHNGSSIANVLSLIPVIPSKTIETLRKDTSYLEELSDWYRAANLPTLAFYEEKKTKLVWIVDKESADPRTPSGSPTGLNANHKDICKFEDTKHAGYIITREFIEKNLLNNFSDNKSKHQQEIRLAGGQYLDHLSTYFADRPKEIEDEDGDLVDITQEEISGIPSADRIQQLFRELVSMTYGDHASDTIGSASYVNISDAASAKFNRNKVSAMFHNGHIVPCQFKQTKRNGKDLSFEQYAERISLEIPSKYPKSSFGENEILLLIGDVGRGKTTALAHLLYKHRDIFVKNNFVPVRIDMEQISGQGIIDNGSFFSDLVPILSNACRSHMRHDSELCEMEQQEIEIRDNILFFKGGKDERIILADEKSRVAEYVKEIAIRLGLRFTLILDNLDAQYHFFDRHIFTPKGELLRKEAIGAMRTLFDSFENVQSEPLANISLRVLLVLRPETQKYFRVARLRNIARRKAADVYKLMAPPLSEVVGQRNVLLAKLCKMQKRNLDEKEKNCLEEFERIFLSAPTKALKNDKHIIELKTFKDGLNVIERYSNQGLRRTIDHISRYVWLNNENANIGSRFRQHYNSQLLCFLLGDKYRFHQFGSGFQNLFLVRGDLVGDRDDLGKYDDSVRCHAQTYWLKYLVAWYIRSTENPNVNAIVSIFCHGGKYYPEGLVKFCVASLLHVETTNLATPTFRPSSSGSGSVTIESVHITHQGKAIIDDLVWTFNYLQLVVEDPYLPIPKLWLREFSYEKGLDYGYFAEPNDSYMHKRTRMVKMKAKQVFLFLNILEYALNIEEVKYPDMFHNLRKSGFETPDFERIKDVVEGSVSRILSYNDEYSVGDAEIEAKSYRVSADNIYIAHHDEFVKICDQSW